MRRSNNAHKNRRKERAIVNHNIYMTLYKKQLSAIYVKIAEKPTKQLISSKNRMERAIVDLQKVIDRTTENLGYLNI